MKRYGNLFEKVTAFENIYNAAQKAFRGKRTKPQVSPFYFNLENEVIRIREDLLSGQYRPGEYGIFEIREPKVRQICSSKFRDRVVHHAICNILGPIIDRKLIYDTYACRENKGSHAAVRRAQYFVRRSEYFLKCDIKKYFPSIDHAVLKTQMRRLLKDDHLITLLDLIIDHQVPDNAPGKGIPIGNLTSQFFANFYLSGLDHRIKERQALKGYLRYMDDFIIFAEDKDRLHEVLADVSSYLARDLQLTLKETATKIAPVSEGVPFLGFRIFKSLMRLQRANLVRFRKKMRKAEADYIAGCISDRELVKTTSSMIAHVQHSDTLSVRRKDLGRSLRLA